MRSDLDEVVAAIVDAAEGMARPRRPWADPLPARLVWACEGDSVVGARVRLPLGRADHLDQQRQVPVSVDLERDGHVFFVGAPRSGRTQCLITLAGSIAELTGPDDVHLYVLDCGSGGLDVLSTLPHCGAVVGRSESRRAARLLMRLVEELERRYREPGGLRPHIVVMIDRWEGLVAGVGEAPEASDAVMRLLREGASVGIHLMITGDRALLVHPKLSTATDLKYVLRLADPADYAVAGFARQQGVVPGRCMGPGGVEVQIYLLDEEPDPAVQAEVVRQLGAMASRRSAGARFPFRVDALPEQVGFETAWGLRPRQAGPLAIIGVGGDELAALVPRQDRGAFAVIGPARSGRTSVLRGAAMGVLRSEGRVHVLTSRPEEWSDLAGDRLVVERHEAWGESSPAEVVLVDDIDAFPPTQVEAFVAAVARSLVIAAGTPDAFNRSLRGWRVLVRQAQQGLVLSPRTMSDGDAIGLTLSRSTVGGSIRPGLGWLRRGEGPAVEVATISPDIGPG